MKNTVLLVVMLMFALVGLNTGCAKPGTDGQHEFQAVNESLSMPSKGNFRLSLTDAPHKDLKNVFVNIDHVELVLKKGNDVGRVIMGQNMGTIDLLKLRDGVHLPIQDLNLAEDVVVKQFRLILKDEGHFFVRRADDSVCHMKTPSQQKTGLKLMIPGGGVQIKAGMAYSLIVDFDVDHSIVDNGATCLLKPVLKVKTLAEVPQNPDDGSGENPDDGSTGGGETPDDGSGSGETPDDGSTGGGETPDDGSGSGETPDDGSGSGEEPPQETGSGDDGTETGSGDGSDGGGEYIPPADEGDGAPVIIDGDDRFYNL